jgi:hypothetical protein
MLYFAYGSNMQWGRINKRCPSAKFVCRALLPDYRLAFPRYSQNNKCWTASVGRADGVHVWGVVYEIDDRDIMSLNQQEGYRPNRANNKNAHVPIRCHVFDEGVKDKPLEVMTYITNAEGNPPSESRTRKTPNCEYRNRLIDGAKHWRLPETYIGQLEAIEPAE